MITREQIENALNDDTKESFVTKNVDHDLIAINLLRERIPYEECPNIIAGAWYEELFLVDVDIACKFLKEEDLAVLADCNCQINEDNDYISLYV